MIEATNLFKLNLAPERVNLNLSRSQPHYNSHDRVVVYSTVSYTLCDPIFRVRLLSLSAFRFLLSMSISTLMLFFNTPVFDRGATVYEPSSL